jgi:hypothetical protein
MEHAFVLFRGAAVERLWGPPGPARTRSVIFVVLTVLALVTAVADIATAYPNILRWGIAGEGNPFAQLILQRFGFTGLAAVKLGGIAWSALVAWLLYRVGHHRRTWILLGFAIAVNLFGTFTNITA